MVNALTRPYYVVRRRVIRYRDRRRIDRLLLTVAAESPPSEEEVVAPETDSGTNPASPEPRPAAPTPRRMRRMGSPRRLDYLLHVVAGALLFAFYIIPIQIMFLLRSASGAHTNILDNVTITMLATYFVVANKRRMMQPFEGYARYLVPALRRFLMD